MRTPNGEFDEYHTSADDLENLSVDAILTSVDIVKQFVEIIEDDEVYVNQKPHGEPFLKRHPEFGTSRRDIQQAMIWLLNQSDGRRSLFSIANLASIDIDIVRKAAAILTRAGLITRVE